MLFSFEELYRWCNPSTVKGVIHVGAHLCQELEYYRRLSLTDKDIVWVEANPNLVAQAKAMYPNSTIIQALCTDVAGKEYPFMVTSNEGQSSSILEFGVHAIHHPHVTSVDNITLTSSRLEDILDLESIKYYNMMNLDVQGAEMLVLKGAPKILPSIDYIYIEVNIDEVYKGCAQLPEMDAFMEEHGFQRVCEKIYQEYKWGDALYVRKTKL